MKTFSLSLTFLLISTFCLAQMAPIDFEADGRGAAWTWTTFENVDNPALEIVSNPDKTEPNVSDKVAKFTARSGGQPWAGCESQHGSDIGTFTLDASTSTIRIMVYKSVISDVGIKLVESSSASLGEIKVANTKVDEWEELTFDFSSREGIAYDQIVIFMDFGSRSSDNICYFDHISFGEQTPLPEPSAAADDPKFLEENVISMFCGLYTDVTVDTWRTVWSNASLTEVQVDGNDVKKYSGLDFVGIETVGENLIDASTMDHFNLAFWSPNSTKFKVKLVDFGSDGEYQGGDDSEHEIVFDGPDTEEWVYVRIPLSDFTNLSSTSHIAQLIFASEPTGQSVVYIDNVFFSKGSPAGILSKSHSNAIQIYPNPARALIHVKYAPYTIVSTIQVTDVTGRVVRTFSPDGSNKELAIDISALSHGTYFVRAKTENGTLSSKFIVR